MGKKWVGGIQLVNGWNNTVAFHSAPTVGLNAMGTYAKWSLMLDWYGGPGNFGTNSGWHNLYDTVLTLTPSSKFAMYLNYDYDEQQFFDGPLKNGTIGTWQGLAGAFHFTFNSKRSFTPRIEWFDDPEGAAIGSSPYSNGDLVRQSVKEGTLTLEYKFLEGLMWRGEYRYDWSNQPFFLSRSGMQLHHRIVYPGREQRPGQFESPEHADLRGHRLLRSEALAGGASAIMQEQCSEWTLIEGRI